MCGILGLSFPGDSPLAGDQARVKRLVRGLYHASERRGREASGLAVVSGGTTLEYLRSYLPASELTKFPEFADAVGDGSGGLALMGHSRLVTNGSELQEDNNQPVSRNDWVVVHNGILTNIDELWRSEPGWTREAEVDSEWIPARLGASDDLGAALQQLDREVEGTYSIGGLSARRKTLVLATNCGSLYTVLHAALGLFAFASERLILEYWIDRSGGVLPAELKESIKQLEPGKVIVADPTCGAVTETDLRASTEAPSQELELPEPAAAGEAWEIRRVAPPGAEAPPEIPRLSDLQSEPIVRLRGKVTKHFDQALTRSAALKRCSRCILPETIPFIEFDSDGVCNFCRHYKPIETKGDAALRKFFADLPPATRGVDCIMTFSGGRDSCYGLHYLVSELGVRPVAYTYDWGMITDLGRRNQARLCGELGIEHIIISADIRRKRANIRKNVGAWLRKPNLGTVPLFMAGDKQYFYFANKLREQTRAPAVVLCENLLETTNFKSGFCGIRPKFGTEHTYSLSMGNKARMIGYYLKAWAGNPKYLNASMFDTVHAFFSYYFIPHDYLNFFDYMPWDEETLDCTLRDTYNWEFADDCASSWRIGDGTAAFYNYIYFTLAGFTEHDTFRSNQIREGMLTRDRALELVGRDNVSRFDSMIWYCDTIGVDPEHAMSAIHSAKLVPPLG